MELTIPLGVATTGQYFNTNNDTDTNVKKSNKKRKIPVRDVPNGKDIYNQTRLAETEEKTLDRMSNNYTRSQYPKQTNIVPNYYNQLAATLNKTKFSTTPRFDRIATQYDPNNDLDDVYVDMPYMRNTEGNANQIFQSTSIDRDHLFLSDEYQIFQEMNQKPPQKIPGVARSQPERIRRPPNGPPKTISESNLEVVEGFQNTSDNNLLNISEKLTDNADSMRRILSEDVGGGAGSCKRRQTPHDMMKSRRLIGVTPDYKSVMVDDEIAKYPAFNREREQREPLTDYPQYLAQFEQQTFDSVGLPSAPNDVHKSIDKSTMALFERNVSEAGGWTQYDQDGSMSYGIVPDSELYHDNMVPFFKEKNGYGSNDLRNQHVMNYKNELFTGNLKSTWNKKTEVRPHFTPVADLSFIYGTPVRPEEEKTRFIPSLYRQNEKLFDEVRVTPGLNLDYNQISTMGNFDLYRAMPKTVDELRIKTDQKQTYEGRIIPGMKGQERPVQAPVISYRPDGFKVTTEKDLLPKTDVNDGPRTRENFIMKETDRANQHIEYTGGAFNGEIAVERNVPEYMRAKIKESDRQNFMLPKPLQKFAKDSTMYNQNQASYHVEWTARDQTGYTNRTGPTVSATGGKTYADPSDIARTTIRQITSAEPFVPTNIAPNTMRGTTPNMDLARPTTKEITAESPLNPQAPNLATQQRTYVSDVARSTIRETTLDPIAPSNCNGEQSTYADYTDIMKTTTRETTVQIPYGNFVMPINQTQGSANTFNRDPTRATIRETTVQIPYQTVVTEINQSQGQAAAFNRTPLRTTTRETTDQVMQNNFVSAVDQAQGQASTFDRTPTRTTVRETTDQIQQNNFITSVDQAQGQAASFNRAPMRTTIKEGTVQIQYNTNTTGVDQAQGQAASFNRTPLRTTIKEGTVEIQYNTNATGVDQAQGQAASFNRTPLRTTTKEGTVEIQYNTNTTAVDQAQGQASSFNRLPLRTTTKQTTINNNHIGGPTNDTNAKGYGYMAETHQAPNTNRQFTVQEVYVPPVEGDARHRSYNDAYNAQIDDRKEMTQVYRFPTLSGVKIGPIAEQVNMYLKNDDNKMPGPNPGFSVNNNQDRPIPRSTTKSIDLIPESMHIDPIMLKQLNSNPYNIPYFGKTNN